MGLSYAITRYYSDPRSTHPLSTVITTLSFTFSLLCLVLIPVDVLSTAYSRELESNAQVIRIVYYTVYVGLAILAFVLIPFAYFYVEDWLQDDDAIADSQPILTPSKRIGAGGSSSRYRRRSKTCIEQLTACCQRGCGAMKYTSIFVFVVIVLTVIGVLMEPSVTAAVTAAATGHHAGSSGSDHASEHANEHATDHASEHEHDTTSGGGGGFTSMTKADLQNSIRTLLDFKSGGAGERALLLIIGVLTAVGVVNFVLYTGFGLAALPISMIRSSLSGVVGAGGSASGGGQRTVEEESLFVEYERSQLRVRRSEIEKKYGKRATSKEARDELAKIDALDRVKQRQLAALQKINQSWYHRIRRVLVPFRWLVGALLLLVSIMICVSLLISLVDRLLHSTCGLKCGYALSDDRVANYVNPIDQLLLALSRYFPVDYLVFAFLCLYFFAVSLYGLVRLGVRLCVCGCVQLFEVRARRTWSSALLIVSFLMMCVLLALCVWLLTLAPQYMTFGTQHYVPRAGVSDS